MLNVVEYADVTDVADAHGGEDSQGDGLPRPELAMRSKEVLRLGLAATLVIVDVAGLLGAAVVAIIATGRPASDLHSARFLLVFGLLVLVISAARGSYSSASLVQGHRAAREMVVNILLAAMVVLATSLFLNGGDRIPGVQFLTHLFFSLCLLGLTRPLIAYAARRMGSGTFRNEVLLLDGATVEPEPNSIVIHADYSHLGSRSLDPVLLDRIGLALRHCDRVFLACPPARRRQWIELLRGFDIELEVLYPELQTANPRNLNFYSGQPTLQVGCTALKVHDRILKRALDLAIALTAVALLAPLLLTTAAAIKLDSPGPVLFRQPRIGQSNRLFEIFKFRSMDVAQEDRHGAQSTSRGDRRVTRVGAVIRRLSIDELPQLFNVIRGEMSIAGPRPHAIGSKAEDLLFWEIEAAYFERHAVKPGMTGLAQVRGYRGATERRSDLSLRLQADLEYLSGWTIWRDIWIIARTAGVFLQKNAF